MTQKASAESAEIPGLAVGAEPTAPCAEGAPPPIRLEASGLVKRYRGRVVVDAVDLAVRAGEIHGLLGPNGAGKTTCFYMLTGLVEPDAGSVRLGGIDITRDPMHRRARRGIGYLPQETSVFRRLSARENLLAVLEFLPLTREQREERAEALLAELGIHHLADRTAEVLSGGEKRRLEIARALCMNPKFMLLDEPFAGIDPLAVADLKGIMDHLRGRGIGILISDHNVRDTLRVCDRASILVEGRVIESGPPEAVVRNEAVCRHYLGEGFRL
ncbi:MAG: LPS export ABC transporter ATP-binding protein [Desulfobacterales bacterium]